MSLWRASKTVLRENIIYFVEFFKKNGDSKFDFHLKYFTFI